MSASAQIKVEKIYANIDRMLESANGVRGYINRVVYAQYQKAQIERFKSGGDGSKSVVTSEGDKWDALDKKYLKRKRVKHAKDDYSGNQMLVATGRLLRETVLARKRTLKYGLEVYVITPYAKYVNESRPFMTFSSRTRRSILDGMRRYMRYGK